MKSKKRKNILCVILAKNCLETISTVIEDINENLGEYVSRIVVIDNASTDETVKKAQGTLTKLSIQSDILMNRINYGLGGSYKIGLDYAFKSNFDFVVFVHGDGSVSTKHLKKVLQDPNFQFKEAWFSDRFSSKHNLQNFSAIRMIGNKALSLFASFLTLRKIPDLNGGGLCLLRTESFIGKYNNTVRRLVNDVDFISRLVLYCCFRKYNFSFIGIDHKEQEAKPLKRMVSQFVKSSIVLIKYFLSPFKVFKEYNIQYMRGFYFKTIEIRNSVVEVKQKDMDRLTDLAIAKRHMPTVMGKKVSEDETIEEVRETINTTALKAKSEALFAAKLKRIRQKKLEAAKDKPITKFKKKKVDRPNFSKYIPTIDEIELCEHKSDKSLEIYWELDEKNLNFDSLKLFVNTFFKIWSPSNITIQLIATNVLDQEEIFNFVRYLRQLGVKTLVSSNGSYSPELWKDYSKHAAKLSLIHSSSDHENYISSLVEVSDYNTGICTQINLQPENFYNGFSVYNEINRTGITHENYLCIDGEIGDFDQDHRSLINSVPESNILKKASNGYSLFKENNDDNARLMINHDSRLKFTNIEDVSSKIISEKYQFLFSEAR